MDAVAATAGDQVLASGDAAVAAERGGRGGAPGRGQADRAAVVYGTFVRAFSLIHLVFRVHVSERQYPAAAAGLIGLTNSATLGFNDLPVRLQTDPGGGHPGPGTSPEGWTPADDLLPRTAGPTSWRRRRSPRSIP